MKKTILALQVIAILAGVIFILLAMLFMDYSSNDSENSAIMISGAILFAAGLIGLSRK